MALVKLLRCARRSSVAVLASLAGLFAVSAAAPAQAKDIIVTIAHVKARDALDITPADFYARVTIDGSIYLTPRISQRNEINPNWQIRHTLPAGASPATYNISLEIWDKDLIIDDMVDINARTDRPKRHLDFTVNDNSCKIRGFSTLYLCTNPITREGNERKKAHVTFSVDVQ